MKLCVKNAMVVEAASKMSDAISLLATADVDSYLEELNEIHGYLVGYANALQDIAESNPALENEEV